MGFEYGTPRRMWEVNYGAISNLQLHLIAPPEFSAPSGAATHYGYGDTELGVKYRFVQETTYCPQIGVFPLLEAPTGDEKTGLGTGHLQAFLPVWLQKSFGQWLTYGGGGYWINPGTGNRDWWVRRGSVATTGDNQPDCGRGIISPDGANGWGQPEHGFQSRRHL